MARHFSREKTSRLPSGYLEPLLLPDSLDALLVDAPALEPQQARDRAIPVAAEPAGQINDLPDEQRLVLLRPQTSTLSRSRLPEHSARSALRDVQLGQDVRDGFATVLRAQKFPSATSFKIALSRAWSATSLFSRPFSFSSSRSRLA